MTWILNDFFLAMPPVDCETIEAKIGQCCNGLCGLQRKDLWICVFLTMLKVALRNVRLAPILLKKSPLAHERNFSAPLVRPTLGDVRDHIDSRKTDRDFRTCPT